MATTVAFLAALPGRNKDSDDVEHRDAAYVHCQEPMSPADPELRGLHWPISTQAGPTEFLSVYLRTGFCGAGADSRWKYAAHDRRPSIHSAVNYQHGDIVSNYDNAHQAVHPAAARERPSLNDLALSPQGLADAPASETDPDSLVYAGNS